MTKSNNPAVIAALVVVLVLSVAGVCVELRNVQSASTSSSTAPQSSPSTSSDASDSNADPAATAPAPMLAPAQPATVIEPAPRPTTVVSLPQPTQVNDPFVAPPPAGLNPSPTGPVPPLTSPPAIIPLPNASSTSNPTPTRPAEPAASPAGAMTAGIPAAAAAQQNPFGDISSLHVSAVIVGGDRIAAIVEGPGTPATSVTVGDPIGGCTVTSITDSAVRVSCKTGTQTLLIGGVSAEQPGIAASPRQDTTKNATP